MSTKNSRKRVFVLAVLWLYHFVNNAVFLGLISEHPVRAPLCGPGALAR